MPVLAQEWLYLIIQALRKWPFGVQSVPVKDIFLYPLTRNFKTVLKNGACQ